MHYRILGVLAACALTMGGFAGATAHAADVVSLDVSPLGTCPVSGEELGGMGAPVVKEYNGQEVRFCCGGCPAKFEKNLDASMKKVDESIVAAEKDHYPLQTCPVSGNILGAMGDPVDIVYKNHLVRLCCSSCKKSFEEDPAKYMAKVNAAIVEKQSADYPLDTCVVKDEKLGSMGDPVNVIIGDQLVRLCCAPCEKELKANPAKYLKKLDDAEKAKK